MTWESILKSSWSTKNFKLLKQVALELIEELEIGEYTIIELYPIFQRKMTERRTKHFTIWSKGHGQEWFQQKFPRIARGAGLEVFTTPIPSRMQAVRKE